MRWKASWFLKTLVPRNFVAYILYWLLLTASQLRSELLINIQLFNLPHPRLRTFRNNCRPDINCQSPVWRSLVKTWCIERVRGPGAEFPNKSSRLCDYLLALSIILKYCAVADHSISTGSPAPAPALAASTQLSHRNKHFQKMGVLVIRSMGNEWAHKWSTQHIWENVLNTGKNVGKANDKRPQEES